MNNSCVVGGEGWLWTVQETQVNLKGRSLPIEANIRPQHLPTSNEHELTVYRFSNSNTPNQQPLSCMGCKGFSPGTAPYNGSAGT